MSYMTEVNKLQIEMRHLERMLSAPDDEHVDLLVQQSKRVRSASSLLVRALARHRDQLQPKEGTST